jgi:hypothetical protein
MEGRAAKEGAEGIRVYLIALAFSVRAGDNMILFSFVQVWTGCFILSTNRGTRFGWESITKR